MTASPDPGTGRRPFRLTLEGTSVALTRALVRRATAHLPAEVAYHAVLLADEIVTNALVHGGGGFSLELTMLPDRVRVAVADRSPTMPELLVGPLEREQGRGLAIVSALASSWGADTREDGKAVWFELELQPA